MNDQQFQDFVYQMTSAISSLGASQAQSSQQLSQQLNEISNQLAQSVGPQAAASAAGVFVDTFNRSFNFNAMKPQERPDQISQNQVFIAGFSPAAASVLNRGGGGTGGLDRNELESIISRLPIVGPVWDTMKSIVSFFMSPANLVTLGGMGVAFLALKKFFSDSPAGEFFKQTMSDMYRLITDTLGKIVNFFTEDEFTGEDLRTKISTVKDDFVAGVKNFFTEGGWFHTNIMRPMMESFKHATNQILTSSGLFEETADGVSFKYAEEFNKFKEIIPRIPSIMESVDKLLPNINELVGLATTKLNELDTEGFNKTLQKLMDNFNIVLKNLNDHHIPQMITPLTYVAHAVHNALGRIRPGRLGVPTIDGSLNDGIGAPPPFPSTAPAQTLLDDAVKFDNNDNFIAAKEGGILTQRLDRIAEGMEKLIEVTSNTSNGGTIINQTKNTLGGRKTPKFANFDEAPGMDQMSFA